MTVLKKYGHRIFAELDEKLAMVGFYVEYKEGSSDQPIEKPARRTRKASNRPIVFGNVALFYVDGVGPSYSPFSLIGQVREKCSGLAARPVRRDELEKAIVDMLKTEKKRVSGAISQLITDGTLRVAGE
jgi:hypothetical protein